MSLLSKNDSTTYIVQNGHSSTEKALVFRNSSTTQKCTHCNKQAKLTFQGHYLCTQVPNTATELRKDMLDKHTLQLSFIWIGLLQLIT
jgi:hypothetical protein